MCVVAMWFIQLSVFSQYTYVDQLPQNINKKYNNNKKEEKSTIEYDNNKLILTTKTTTIINNNTNNKKLIKLGDVHVMHSNLS